MKTYSKYIPILLIVLGVITSIYTVNPVSRNLSLTSLTEAAGTLCATPLPSGYTCSIVAEYSSADVGSSSYINDACYSLGYHTADDFFYTCSEQLADGLCNGQDCSGLSQIEYRVVRRTCTNDSPPNDQCISCADRSFGVFQCPDNSSGGSGGSGGGVPTVDLVANPASVSSGGSSTLTWTVSNATSCTASGAWTGSKSSTGGSQVQSSITSTRTYTITCSNSNGSASDSATVTVGGAVVNFDLLGGVTAPYTQSVSGNNPLNGVDAQFNVNIASGCAATCDFDSNGFYICDYQCSRLEYQLRCNPTDSWKTFPSATRYNPENGVNYNRTFTNQCDYSSSSRMEGRVLVTKTSPTNSTTQPEDNVPITVTTPASATCAPNSQTIQAGGTAVVSASYTGQDPKTCTWSGGGTPATSSSCSPFTTTYNTPGTKTITFNLNAANGAASCTATVNVLDPNIPAGASCSPTNTNVTTGQSVEITGTPSGDTPFTCAWSAPGGSPSTGTSCTSFVTSYSTTGTKTITYTVTDRDGETASCQSTINVSAPASAPTVTLTANPTSVSSGQSSTLTWTVSNATSCTASGDWSGSKSVTGGNELQTNITANKSYTLTCSNSGGSTPATATVTVTGGSPSTSGSCSAVNPTVNVGEAASFVGTATGPSPIRCQWNSTGGTPASSGLLSSTVCGSYSTTYSTPGTKTVMYIVNTPERQIYPTCSVTVVDNTPTPTYTLTAVRNGQGTITSDLPGINCGSTCTGVYDEGTAVVLTATPAAGWSFIEWLGDCAATAGNTCTVQVNGPRTVTAKFRPNTIYEEF